MKVALNGVNLHYTEVGDGDHALVFLHFWGSSSLEWTEVIQGLSNEYRCIALDARGSGASDAPSSGYRISDLADDVQGIIAALQLKSYVVVGHSMGGKTAQVLAARRPEGLKGIALVASSPASPMQIDQARRDQMKSAYSNADSVNWVLDNVLSSSPISEASRKQFIVDALRLSPSSRDGWVDIGAPADYSKEIANVNVPVTVIAGEDDQVDPPEVVRGQILPAFVNPETHFLAKKGHLLPLEAPKELVQILKPFAKRVFA